ncbi:AP-3 complex subunit sigma [Wickerhamiella sorbophila]|uniref:AP complex subunit sigma n=1 Tax=Wickerhamiella sorbophila TaxID=45607 RepID=A0A2T0FH39_9ASCO|nr:AP-3 complex subunit sigma [Wickerhamiella sorbophila]PRT54323.1 AP-3 complex subunit sigma [Wickerhamiella sorbophila]
MIHGVLIVNNSGQPRLIKFYTPIEVSVQQRLLKQVYNMLLERSANQCNFMALPPILLEAFDDGEEKIRVIYRQYATLNFVFMVDQQESELGILDLIQIFVESLDRCFESVCELDLIFGWEVLETVLEELIQGGMVLETSVAKIVDAVDMANKAGTVDQGDTITAATRAISSATSLFKYYISPDVRR